MNNQYLYNKYLTIFHTTTNFSHRRQARRDSNMYGRLLGMSEAELREDKLPVVDFAELLGLKGSIASDGIE